MIDGLCMPVPQPQLFSTKIKQFFNILLLAAVLFSPSVLAWTNWPVASVLNIPIQSDVVLFTSSAQIEIQSKSTTIYKLILL